MKNRVLFLLLAGGLLAGCGPRGFVIHSGYAPNYSHQYNTYGIAYDPLTAADTTLQHEAIITEINRQMQVRGFSYTDTNPEMLVFYSLHPDRMKINTYVRSFRNPEVDYTVDKAFLKRGILLIQFQDTFMNKTVWQGYAARVSPDGQFIGKDVRVAARTVLSGYRTFSLLYQAQQRDRTGM